MKRNTEALLSLAKTIQKANRKGTFEQDTWGEMSLRDPDNRPTISVRECQTTQCIAGHAVADAGLYPHVSRPSYIGRPSTSVYVDWEWVRTPKGRKFRHTPEEARKILGLTRREASILFSGYWQPKPPLSVPGALRKLAKGASIEDVTDPDFWEDGGSLLTGIDADPWPSIQSDPNLVKVTP